MAEEGVNASLKPETRNLKPDRKELRRQRALQRQELHARTKDLKKEVDRAEKQVAIYEVERTRLMEQLAGDPAKIDFMALSQRLAYIQEEIERYTQRWEKAALELDEVMGGEGTDAE